MNSLTEDLTRIERLDEAVRGAQLVVCISADDSLDHFEIGDISNGPLPSEVEAPNGRRVIGVVALRDGEAVSRLVVDLSESSIYTLSSACLGYIFARAHAAVAGIGLPQLAPSLDKKTEVV